MEARPLQWPAAEQIKRAGIEQCIRWHRFLPSPNGKRQRELLQTLATRMGQLRSSDPDGYVAASKKVGW